MVADTLFALLLAGLLAAIFRRWMRCSPPRSAADIRRFSRRLSRTVYLALYLTIGAVQLRNIIGGLGYADGSAHNIEALRAGSAIFLVHGLVALVWIRVLAYLAWRRYRSGLESDTEHRSAGSAAPSFLRPY